MRVRKNYSRDIKISLPILCSLASNCGQIEGIVTSRPNVRREIVEVFGNFMHEEEDKLVELVNVPMKR
jgi:hypothetical protein